jgi:glucosyl-3-phosphoglycerate synthase
MGRAGDLGVRDWFAYRTFDGSAYTVASLQGVGRPSISVVLPARGVSDTIEGVLDGIEPVRDAGLIDEVVVMVTAEDLDTANIAAERDVSVLQRDDVLPHLGPCIGKGDALWRALSATTGEIVLFLDTDTRNFDVRFVTGLLGPLIENPDLQFVKGAFDRPLLLDESRHEGEGGRVTELVARPLINLYFPELAGFVQPLAGESAARRSLLERISFPVGYGVEIGLLIDALSVVGLRGLGQVDLGRREDGSKSLRDLGPMAHSVLVTVLRRAGVEPQQTPEHIGLAGWDGLEFREVPTIERPPLESLRGRRAESVR